PTCVVRMRSVLSFMTLSSMPQLRGCQFGAFDQRAELAVGDLGIDPASVTDESGKPAVCPSKNAFAPNDIRKLADALRHEFRMFDVVGAGVDHAGDQHL